MYQNVPCLNVSIEHNNKFLKYGISSRKITYFSLRKRLEKSTEPIKFNEKGQSYLVNKFYYYLLCEFPRSNALCLGCADS